MSLIRHLLFLATFLSSVSIVHAETIRVAVASNFAPVARQLQSDFESTTSHNVIFSVGSSGVLYAQISKGAPFDVFLSADSQRPESLEQAGKVFAGSRQTYARGRLVWWQPEANALSLDNLGAFSGRLAIANPRFAPYGQAAMSVLAKLQLNTLPLVRGANVSQAFQFADTGNAPAALVPLSLLKPKLSPNLSAKSGATSKYSHFVLIPQDWHEEIAQQMVILKDSKKIQAALEFSDFLLSNASQTRIAQLGYQHP